jgi:hypothetical protein
MKKEFFSLKERDSEREKKGRYIFRYSVVDILEFSHMWS